VVSPVFFSTRADGTVVPGLGAVPLDGERPVLFVGNHQTFSPDLPFLIEQFITERGVLLRGLAHPATMAAVTGGGDGGGGGGLGGAVGGAVGGTVGGTVGGVAGGTVGAMVGGTVGGTWGGTVGEAVGGAVGVGSGRNCSPHHGMPFAFASRNETSNLDRSCSGH